MLLLVARPMLRLLVARLMWSGTAHAPRSRDVHDHGVAPYLVGRARHSDLEGQGVAEGYERYAFVVAIARHARQVHIRQLPELGEMVRELILPEAGWDLGHEEPELLPQVD